jgi:NAD(P)-dependent dehydrogenase (short-subunit alcohol dehydrogenase family)
MGEERSGRSVVITGASSGIGKACALRLDGSGVRVFAGVRSEADGMSLKQEASYRLTPILMDVTFPDTIASAHQVVAEAVGGDGLAGVVNSAGIYCGGPLEFTAVEEIREEFEVNFFGAVAVTQAFVPLLRSGRGRIVNVSSVSGVFALPFLGPYAASKFALEAISDSWRVELRPWGIRVSVVEPGVVETPFLEKALAKLREKREKLPPEAHDLYGSIFGLSERHRHKHHGIPADRVARAVEHALFSRRPKLRYLVGAEAKSVPVFRAMPARLRDWIIAKHLPKYG